MNKFYWTAWHNQTQLAPLTQTGSIRLQVVGQCNKNETLTKPNLEQCHWSSERGSGLLIGPSLQIKCSGPGFCDLEFSRELRFWFRVHCCFCVVVMFHFVSFLCLCFHPPGKILNLKLFSDAFMECECQIENTCAYVNEACCLKSSQCSVRVEMCFIRTGPFSLFQKPSVLSIYGPVFLFLCLSFYLFSCSSSVIFVAFWCVHLLFPLLNLSVFSWSVHICFTPYFGLLELGLDNTFFVAAAPLQH